MAGFTLYPKRKMKKLLKDGEYDEAIRFGKSLEEKFADDHDFMFIMGSAFFIADDAEKALPYFERAFELDRKDVETLTLKTNVHLALQQKDAAIDCVNKILEIQPQNDEALVLLEKLNEF